MPEPRPNVSPPATLLRDATHIPYVDDAGDPRYPLFRIDCLFEQDGDKYGSTHWRGEPLADLPDGRIWNMTGLSYAWPEPMDEARVETWARETWWPQYLDSERRGGDSPRNLNARLEDMDVGFTLYESWVCGWFGHWTFDLGRSDADVLASFERYVRRWERFQDWSPETNQKWKDQHGVYPLCLMGAEDRWRWSGGPGPDDREPPPCRCEHCKRQGLVRIGH